MRVIADLHIHSKFSRATSSNMNIPEIEHCAKLKGLNLVGTGDFTHPKWIKTLEESLIEDSSADIHKPVDNPKSSVNFILTTEVSTIFEFRNQSKKVHQVILTPSLSVAEQINDRLARYGDLSVDGRPMLKMSAPELVEEVMQTSPDNEVFPAHAWTPWFSIFGSFSGFDSFTDCNQDMSNKVHALETGLSSDPPMNWRISSLDRLTLISNSDSHSAWPWRIGREANILELERASYMEVIEALRHKEKKKMKLTIETNPAYGKYHWTGHRNCGFSASAVKAAALNNICPICHQRLTKGVDQRIEELADRPKGYKPEGAPLYIHLLPLHEIIAAVLKIEVLSSPRVWGIYNKLIATFGDEYTVLLDVTEEDLTKTTDLSIARGIMQVRRDEIIIEPGYDGVYGKVITRESRQSKELTSQGSIKKGQPNLDDFV